MSNKIERKFTPEECIENGGHFWKYWSANDSIDPKTFNQGNIRYDVYYPNGEPQYRGCPLCGTVEQEIHDWVNINKKRENNERLQ